MQFLFVGSFDGGFTDIGSAGIGRRVESVFVLDGNGTHVAERMSSSAAVRIVPCQPSADLNAREVGPEYGEFRHLGIRQPLPDRHGLEAPLALY